MIRPTAEIPVYLYPDFVDMRKSIDGLAALVEQETDQSPFFAMIFVFCNRQRDKVKLLYWECNGFVLWYKRLEKFRFKWPVLMLPKRWMGTCSISYWMVMTFGPPNRIHHWSTRH